MSGSKGARRVVPPGLEGETLLVHQPPVEPRRAAARQHRGEHLEGVGVLRAVVRGRVALEHDGQLRLLPQPDAPLASLLRLDHGHRRRVGAARNAFEPRPDLREEIRRLEIPDGHHDGVVRPVVGVVPDPEVGRRQPLDVLREPDRRQAVRVSREDAEAEQLGEASDRIVLGARPALLHDDALLGLHLPGIEEEVPHPVGLELEHQIELVRGDGHVVRGDVAAREGVVLAAGRLDELREDARARRSASP